MLAILPNVLNSGASSNIFGTIKRFYSRVEDYPTYRKINGSAAWRNNNPGNLVYSEDALNSPWFAKTGVVKSQTTKFAKFPSEEIGWASLLSLLTNKYGALLVPDALLIYAPESDHNDPIGYANSLEKAGVDLKKTVGEQVGSVAQQIKKIEGWIVGQKEEKK